MKYIVLIICFLCYKNSFAQNSLRYKLTGTVTNSIDGKPMQGANVIVTETGYGTNTDEKGNFEVLVPRGIYFLSVSYQSYFTKKEKIVIPNMKTIAIVLFEKENSLNEVVVTGKNADQNIKRMETGVTNISIKTLKKIPVLMGEVDVVKSLFTLPGVATVGEGATGFNVRGGAIDQNLVLLDDAPVFNASHLMGFFSVFNPDALSNMNFYRGGTPARFGGRTASVLDIQLKDANADTLKITGGIGPIASRIMVEAPIIPKKLSAYFAVRASYLGYLFKILPNKQIKNTRANFADFTFKTNYKVSTKDRIALTAFHGIDNFKLSGDSLSKNEINSTSSNFNWKSTTATLVWNHFVSDKFNFKVASSLSNYKAGIASTDSLTGYDLTTSVLYKSVKAEAFYQLTKSQKLDLGLSMVQYDISPNTLVPSQGSSVNALKLQDEKANELALYINDEIKLSKFASIGIGARYVMYTQLGPGVINTFDPTLPKTIGSIASTQNFTSGQKMKTYAGLEPRLSLNLAVNEFNAIKLSYNKMQQFVQMVQNTTAALPTNRWKVADASLKPQIVDQASVGYYKNDIEKIYEASFEVFYKKMANTLEYADGSNPLFETLPERSLLQGNGYAYGAELYLKKNLGVFTGWFSYTYSQARVMVNGGFPQNTINNGNYFAPNYNKPHVLNILGNYQINENTSFSSNFTYSTGRPVTYPEYQFRVGGLTVPQYGYRNQGKIPDYVRLDVSYNVDPKPNTKRKIKGSWNFSVYNILNTRNAYSVFFKTRQFANRFTRGVDIYKFSVLGSAIPSITYNFKF